MFRTLFIFALAAAAVSAADTLLVGAPSEADPESPEVGELLTKVMASQNSADKVTKVLKVTKQVVSGIKYDVEFETENSTAGTKNTCKAVFVSQLWLSKEPRVLSYECSKKE